MKGHSSENSTVVLYQVNSAHKNGLQVCVSLWRLGGTLPEAEAFVCVLLENGKVCDSDGTDLLYGARSNWPFLSTQELRVVAHPAVQPSGWLILWGPTWDHSVAQWQAPKFSPKTTGCKGRWWYSLNPHYCNSVMSPNFPFYLLWHLLLHPHRKWAFWVPALRHQITPTFDGCFAESPNKLLQVYLLV